MARQIYRQQALDRLASPGDIDQLTTVVRPWHWLGLVVLAMLCAAALLWALFGRVQETVEGIGLLVNPGRVRSLETRVDGQVLSLPVRAGDEVQEGDLVAQLVQPELRKKLQEAQVKLAEHERFHKAQLGLEKIRLAQQHKYSNEHRSLLQEHADETRKLADELWEKNVAATKKQQERIAEITAEGQELDENIRAQLESLQALAERRLATTDQLTRTQSSLFETRRLSSELQSNLVEIEIQHQEARQFFVEQLNRAADLKLQIKKIDLEIIALEQQIARDQAQRELEIALQAETVKLLEQQLAEDEAVRSPYSGRLLELTIKPGQVVTPGFRIGAIEKSELDPGEPDELRVLAYFALKDGKRVRQGMKALVTPTTVRRERYGSIVASVDRTAPFPTTQAAAASAVGNAEIFAPLSNQGGVIEIEVELTPADTLSGYLWTSAGPPRQFTSGTSARVRVVVEERAPISYLLPMFRRLVYGSDEPR